jgi:hypothetical protein
MKSNGCRFGRAHLTAWLSDPRRVRRRLYARAPIYFANQPDVEGDPDVAAALRPIADGEIGHVFGHPDDRQPCDDPTTGMPFGSTQENLAIAAAGEFHEATETDPSIAKETHAEIFDDVADRFATRAKAEHAHAKRDTRLSQRSPEAGDPRSFPRDAEPAAALTESDNADPRKTLQP